MGLVAARGTCGACVALVALLCQAEAWTWVSQQSNCACNFVADFSHLFLQERAGPGLSPQPLLHTLTRGDIPEVTCVCRGASRRGGEAPAAGGLAPLQRPSRGGEGGVESLKEACCGETRRQVRL